MGPLARRENPLAFWIMLLAGAGIFTASLWAPWAARGCVRQGLVRKENRLVKAAVWVELRANVPIERFGTASLRIARFRELLWGACALLGLVAGWTVFRLAVEGFTRACWLLVCGVVWTLGWIVLGQLLTTVLNTMEALTK